MMKSMHINYLLTVTPVSIVHIYLLIKLLVK